MSNTVCASGIRNACMSDLSSGNEDSANIPIKGLEKNINHDKKIKQITKNPTKNGEGGRSQSRNALTKQSARGGGEERRKEDGTAEGCESSR
ncbi:hypothetical protein TNCV_3383021 [Trichonephila clavipes]|nr:hypothetical protein TNCV_3383021 [Trichonephila clavipes]